MNSNFNKFLTAGVCDTKQKKVYQSSFIYLVAEVTYAKMQIVQATGDLDRFYSNWHVAFVLDREMCKV